MRVPIRGLTPGDMPLPDHVVAYVRGALRMAAGDRFTIFDPDSRLEASAELVDLGAAGLCARVGSLGPAAVVAERAVTLIQGMAKGDKMDAIVRDATELGATRVVPAIMERSVVRLGGDDRRVERWRRIAVEAARQCGRGDAPEVEAPMGFEEALRRFVAPGEAQGRRAFCLDPRAAEPLGERLLSLGAKDEVVVIVGPEGGLSEEEVKLSERNGASRASLGPFILRTETVCAAALGAILIVGDVGDVGAKGELADEHAE